MEMIPVYGEQEHYVDIEDRNKCTCLFDHVVLGCPVHDVPHKNIVTGELCDRDDPFSTPVI